MQSGMTLSGPAIANSVFFFGLFAGYVRNRKFRDPLVACGHGCLHLPHCPFYTKSPDDTRGFAQQPDESSDEKKAGSSSSDAQKAEPKFSRILYIIMGVFGIVTVVPAAFYSSYLLRQIRLRYYRCKCFHRPSCSLGKEQYRRPPECDGWDLADDGFYESPCGNKRVQAIRIRSSSGRTAYAKQYFKHEKNGKAA